MLKNAAFFLAGIFVAYTYPDIGAFLFDWIKVGIQFAKQFTA